MRKVFYILLFGLAISNDLMSQDPHFSQYYSAPIYLNPAFAGTSNLNRVSINQRVQWPVLESAYSTSAVSFDIYRPDVKSGFGGMITNDRAGTAGLRTVTAGIVYSYKIQMPNMWVVTPGLYFGFGSRGLDNSRLVLGDQIEFGNPDSPSIDPSLGGYANIYYVDFASGLLFYNKNTWIGTSWWHMNQPNISFFERIDRLPAKINIHGGTRIQFYSGPGNIVKTSYLSPSFVMNMQGPMSQLDLGLNYHADPIIIGLWYRGIPLKKDPIDQVVRDAIVFSSGLNFDYLTFQYSYDFTISELSIRSEGAHEIGIQYHFKPRRKKGRMKKSDKILPCPSFIPYDKVIRK